jgi:RNA polymerase sigma-70 factor (ECF subfamily)
MTRRRILKGDTTLFDDLIARHYNELFVYVHNQTNDIETSKDLTQEIFLKAYHNLRNYKPDKASFRTWIYRIATNHCIDHHRKRRLPTTNNYPMEALESNEHDVLEAMINQEDVSLVLSTMDRVLSNRHARILMLRFFSDLSDEEIAQSMNLSVKTVRNVVSASIQTIRDALEVN